MSYTIYYSDPSKYSYPIVVQDNTKYNGVGTGGLTLVGRNYPGYGQVTAENLIHMLENSASTVPPVNPIEGQLWYDSRTKKLRVNDGAANNANWKPINGLFQQETEPTNVISGDVWVDTINFQVKVWNGTEFKLVGPSESGASQTGAIPATVDGTDNQPHDLILNYVGGTIVSVIAKESFTPQGGNPYNLNANLTTGTNLILGGAIFNGISDSANYLRQNGEKIIGSSFMRKDISQSLNGQLSIANDSNALKIGTDPTFIIERLNSGAVANFVNTYNANGSFTFNMKNSNYGNVPILTMGGATGRVEIFSTNTTALSVTGGASFGGNIALGGNLTFINAATTLTVANIVLTSSTQATSTSTGSLVIAGGAAIGKNLQVGGDFYVYNRFFASSTLGGITTGTTGQVLVAGDDGKAYWRSISTSTYQGGPVPGAISIGELTNSTATTNGSLIVAGGVGIAKDVYIGGGVTATSITINSTQVTTASIVTGVTINSSNTTSSTSTTTGALVVKGGAGIGGNLYVGGEIIANKLTIQYTTVTTTLVTTDDVIKTTNATASVSTSTGALQITGGAGIGGAVYGGSLYDASRRVVTTLVDGTGTQAVRSGLTTATFNLLPPTVSVIGGVKSGTANAIYSWVGTTATLTTGASIDIDGQGVIAVNTNTLMTTSTFAEYVTKPATVSGSFLGGIRAGGKFVNISTLSGQLSVSLSAGAGIGITESPASGNAGISGSITLNTATAVARGGVIVPEYATSYIYLSANGTIRIDPPYVLPAATTSTLGGIKAGEGIFIDNSGTISVNTLTAVLIATTSTLGGVTVNPTQPGIIVDPGSGEIGLNINFTATSGILQSFIWDTFNLRYDLITGLSTASVTQLGGVKIGTGIGVSADGTISVTTASFALQTATTALIGGVIIGDNLSIDGNGRVSALNSYVLTTATSSQLGGVKIGTGISVTGDATISVNTSTLMSTATTARFISTTATSSQLGGVKIGANVNITGDGTISVATPYTLTTATASALGGIKIGSNLSITGDGTLSANITPAYTLNTATDLVLGGIILGTTVLADSFGTLNINTATLMATAVTATTARYVSSTATSAQLGGVKIGSNLLITGDGTVTFNTTTLVTTATTAQFVSTTATNSQLGAVIIGAGLTSTGDGTISVNTNTQVAFAASATTATTAQFISTTATAAVLGGIRIGSGLAATGAGVVSVNTASFAYTLPAAAAGTLGGVKIGANINVTPDGTISITPGAYSLPIATSVDLGGVRIGTGITINTTTGVISVNTGTAYVLPAATTSTLGGVIPSSVNFSVGGTGVLTINTSTLYVDYATSATYASYITTIGTTATIGGVKQSTPNPSIVIDPTFGDLALNVNFTATSGLTSLLAWNNGTSKYDVTYSLNSTVTNALTINNSTAATSTSTGALIINNGGVGIGGNIYAGGNLNIVGVSTFTGIVTISNATAALTTASASALHVEGGISLGSGIVAGKGFYSTGTFAGTFSDGSVLDYVNGNGRISVGPNDTLTAYAGGVGTTAMFVASTTSFNVSTGTFTIAGQLAVNGPAWSVYPTGAAQSIAAGTQKLLFQTKEFDTATSYNTTTNRLVPGVLGYYQMNAAFSSVSTLGSGTIFMSIFRNGVEYRRGDRIQTTTGTNAVGCTISTQVLSTTTSDYFEVYVNNSTGLTITGEVGNGVYGPLFNGSFVRGV